MGATVANAPVLSSGWVSERAGAVERTGFPGAATSLPARPQETLRCGTRGRSKPLVSLDDALEDVVKPMTFLEDVLEDVVKPMTFLEDVLEDVVRPMEKLEDVGSSLRSRRIIFFN